MLWTTQKEWGQKNQRSFSSADSWYLCIYDPQKASRHAISTLFGACKLNRSPHETSSAPGSRDKKPSNHEWLLIMLVAHHHLPVRQSLYSHHVDATHMLWDVINGATIFKIATSFTRCSVVWILQLIRSDAVKQLEASTLSGWASRSYNSSSSTFSNGITPKAQGPNKQSATFLFFPV